MRLLVRPCALLHARTEHDDAVIRIEVRELQGRELGILGMPHDKFTEGVKRAVERKSSEDQAAYGMDTQQIRAHAIRSGYYDSPAHDAWAEAAEARTGGRLSSHWWKQFDPYGGTNGNGPELLAGGAYPHALSRIGMAHDTDWSLGRHFQAGPMRSLYGANYDSETLGKFGLDPLSPIRPSTSLYGTGHADWDVQYTQRSQRRSDVPGEVITGVAVAATPSLSDSRHPQFGLYAQAFEKLPGAGVDHPEQRQNIAAAMASEAKLSGLQRIDHVLSGTQDTGVLFAVQGAFNDPAHSRVRIDGKQAAVLPVEQSTTQLQQKLELQTSTTPQQDVAQQVKTMHA